MKDENNNKEKPITPDEISKLDPSTISKIILLDGTILSVQNNTSSFRNNLNNGKNNSNMGGSINLKLNQIQYSNTKAKNTFSYIEWDFPKSKFRNYSNQRNIVYELAESKTEQNENNKIIKDNSRDSALNISRKNKNYSFYESKHVSKIYKKNNNNVSDKESKNISGIFIKNEDNYNYKEINNKDNNENKESEKNEKNEKKLMIKII